MRDAMRGLLRKGSRIEGRLTPATRRVSALDVRKMGIDIMPADDYNVPRRTRVEASRRTREQDFRALLHDQGTGEGHGLGL